jgi:hypothetical protein
MSVLADARVLALNPDEKTLTAGEKLGAPRHWRALGGSERALWGECLGSAVYQVTIDLDDLGYRCSCPSRKFPCKHVIGLMALHVREPGLISAAEAPEWVSTWLAKRSPKPEKGAPAARSPSSAATRQKRADERMQRVLDGVAGLELWLADIERDGLARVQTQPHAFWERQAARLVDAQAPGLASQVRALAAIPTSLPDWPDRVLAGLGRLALLVHGFRRLDQLDPLLQHDVRRLVGLNLGNDEVTEMGELVRDHWIVAGQLEEQDDRLITQRTWLVGQVTGRSALVLQFAPATGGSFPFVGTFGTVQEMELRFWPSARPQRARIEQRLGGARSCSRIPGFDSIECFLASVAADIARLPWHDRSLCVLCGVVVVRRGEGEWYLRDASARGLPLTDGDRWHLLAETGGWPFTLTGEWDGERLRPMGWLPDAAGAAT